MVQDPLIQDPQRLYVEHKYHEQWERTVCGSTYAVPGVDGRSEITTLDLSEQKAGSAPGSVLP